LGGHARPRGVQAVDLCRLRCLGVLWAHGTSTHPTIGKTVPLMTKNITKVILQQEKTVPLMTNNIIKVTMGKIDSRLERTKLLYNIYP
jgi:hypothetical protein